VAPPAARRTSEGFKPNLSTDHAMEKQVLNSFVILRAEGAHTMVRQAVTFQAMGCLATAKQGEPEKHYVGVGSVRSPQLLRAR
jgi:hypothetical protein